MMTFRYTLDANGRPLEYGFINPGIEKTDEPWSSFDIGWWYKNGNTWIKDEALYLISNPLPKTEVEI